MFNRLFASSGLTSKVRISPSRTGPLTLRIIERLVSSKKSTRTWVHCPCDPVRPRIFVTRASLIGLSMTISKQYKSEKSWNSWLDKKDTSTGLNSKRVERERSRRNIGRWGKRFRVGTLSFVWKRFCGMEDSLYVLKLRDTCGCLSWLKRWIHTCNVIKFI